MTDWEAATEKFLSRWRKRRFATGALVCGSYVTGNPSPRSDIDLHILLKSTIKWRERGNEIVDGFLIEYFSNPPRQVRQYFAEDFADNRNMCATQFATGRVLFDRDGETVRLQAEAERWIRKPFKRPGRVQTQAAKYNLWDQLDNFQDSAEHFAPDLRFQYAACVHALVRIYARYRGDSVPNPVKLHRFLTSDELFRKYRDRPFSDSRFAGRVAAAMMVFEPKEMVAALTKLTRYVHDQMGGFEIDGFRLRSKAVDQVEQKVKR